MSIHTQFSPQEITIEKKLVRVRLNDGREINVFQVSAYQEIDGKPELVPGSTYYEDVRQEEIAVDIVSEILSPVVVGNTNFNFSFWQNLSGVWIYSYWNQSLATIEYFNLDGSPYTGTINDLIPGNNPTEGGCCESSYVYEYNGYCYKPITRVVRYDGLAPLVRYFSGGVSYTPATTSKIVEELPGVRYEARMFTIVDGQTFDLATVTEEVSGVAMSFLIPLKTGSVTLETANGVTKFNRNYTQEINAHSEDDTVGGLLKITCNGGKVECMVSVRVRIKPLICEAVTPIVPSMELPVDVVNSETFM